ncbi:arginase family protein [Candidatus Woesearchaeota archaeon]|nr:arginase family protein [Candidatus Woesearchaeota archaeon]
MRLIKIPFSKGSLGKSEGCKYGPDKIAELTKEFWFSEDKTLPVFDVEQIGVDQNNISLTHDNIFKKISEIKTNFIALGGDHSITYSTFKAFAQNFKNPGIIVFDAHPDLMPPNNLDHETYLRKLIEDGIVKKENVILIALRNWDDEEYKYIQNNRLKVYPMKNICMEGIANICDAVMSVAKDFDGLYLSLDIDSVDPAFAPGTGFTEPAGLASRELFYFIHRIKLLKNLKAIDIVEVNPEKDFNDMTSRLAAKLCVEFY